MGVLDYYWLAVINIQIVFTNIIIIIIIIIMTWTWHVRLIYLLLLLPSECFINIQNSK